MAFGAAGGGGFGANAGVDKATKDRNASQARRGRNDSKAKTASSSNQKSSISGFSGAERSSGMGSGPAGRNFGGPVTSRGPSGSAIGRIANNYMNPTEDSTFNAFLHALPGPIGMGMGLTSILNEILGPGTPLTEKQIANITRNNNGGGNAIYGDEANGGGGVPLPVSDPAAPPPPTGTDPDDIMGQLMEAMKGYTNPSNLYYLQQRGLAPMDATEVGSQWQPAFDREFNRSWNTVNPNLISKDMLTDNTIDDNERSQLETMLRQYFPDTFGNQALTAEEQRRQNEYKAGLDTAGYRNQVSSSFNDTSDDDIINSILQSQYDPARASIENQYKRGVFNQAGYDYALGKLDTQKSEGFNKLNEIGGQQRSSLMGDLNSYLDSEYNKAGSTTLSGSYDPAGIGTDFTNRLNSSKSNLSNRITSAAPSIFDTSTITNDAGTVQGVTSRGSLLDTLAARNRTASPSRGIGTTGAF